MKRFPARVFALALLSLLMSKTLRATEWSAWAPANHAGLRWEGRVRFDTDGTAIFDWTQVRVHAQFTGPQIAIYAKTGDNYLDLVVDGKLRAVLGRKPRVDDAPLLKYWLEARFGGGKVFVLSGLGDGKHELLLSKRTGPNIGPVRLQGLRLAAGQRLLVAPKAYKRRIEFVGDSLTNAYGNESLKMECSELPPYENSSLGWARIVTDALGAESQLLAYSGYGVVRNYGDKNPISKDPFPFYYPRTVLAEKSGEWDRSQFKPQVAVCFLGTNDYSTEPTPPAEAFVAAYRAFLAQVREGRGQLPILCLYPSERQILVKQVQEVVAQEQANGLPTQILGLAGPKDGELGCDWHPQVVVHARWAKKIEPKIREMMKWSSE